MKIRFKPDAGPSRDARLPHPEAAFAIVDGECPSCGATPFRAAGVHGSMVRGHDTYTSSAACVGCSAVTGKLILTVSTIFGIEEDERMLNGRARVY